MKELIFDTKKWLIEISNYIIIDYRVLKPNHPYTIYSENYKIYDSFEECLHDLEWEYLVDLNKFPISENSFSETLIKNSKKLTKEEYVNLTTEQKSKYLSN